MNCRTPGLPVHHKHPEFTQTHAHRVCDFHPAISSSVIPFSSCPQSLPASGVFSNESTLLRWPKYWSFSISPSRTDEHPGLISFLQLLQSDPLSISAVLPAPYLSLGSLSMLLSPCPTLHCWLKLAGKGLVWIFSCTLCFVETCVGFPQHHRFCVHLFLLTTYLLSQGLCVLLCTVPQGLYALSKSLCLSSNVTLIPPFA